MKMVFVSNNNCIDKINIEYTPSEWLIDRKALKQFVENPNNCRVDTLLAGSMLKAIKDKTPDDDFCSIAERREE